MSDFWTNFDCWAQRSYYLSQICLVFIASVAVIYTSTQIRSFKKHELLKYLESKESRGARRVVVKEIAPLKGTRWWDDPKKARLEEAASDVSAVYDVMYLFLEGENSDLKEFFHKNWADSIVRVHTILEPFLEHRRETAGTKSYRGFTRLADEVRRFAGGK